MDPDPWLGHALAAVFDGPDRPFRFERSYLSSRLGPGETLVRVDLATVCGSDLHTWAGRRVEPTPTVLGHEGVGTVVAAGSYRQQWLGKRVTWASCAGCGKCSACLHWGLPQKCRSVLKYGHVLHTPGDAPRGTYASHILLSDTTQLVVIPDRVKDPAAASLNCSLATMANVTEALPPHCNVALVQGAGLLGLHGCALLRTAGVSRVLVSDPNPARLATALRFGGEPVNPGDLPSDCADVVIEVAGAPGLFEEAVRILRPGGHYLLAGGVHPHSRIETETEILIRKYLTVKGFHNYADRHLLRAAEFLALSDLPWDSLVSPAFSIWNLDEAFVAARSGMWARVAVRLST